MNAAELQSELSAGDAVFTAIYEKGRTFGKQLTYYVYTIKNEELPARVSLASFVHKIANKLYVEHGVPAGGYAENDDGRDVGYIVTTDRLELPNGEVSTLVGDKQYKVGIYETNRDVTLLNLYSRGHKFAIQSMWSRIIQSEINSKDGLKCDYSQHGIYATIDREILQEYLPSWADDEVKELALEASSVPYDAFRKLRLSGTDITLFAPKRVIDLDPKVATDGTAYAITTLRTIMESPSDLNLHFLRESLEKASRLWDRSFNKHKIMFKIVWKGVRLRPNAVHFGHVIRDANEQDVQQAYRFFEDQGYTITEEVRKLIDESRSEGLAVFLPHYMSSEFRKSSNYVVPLRLAVPIITPENLHLYKDVVSLEYGFERLPKLYSAITKITTDVAACLINAMDNAFTAELHPVVRWEKGSIPVEFIYGPMTFSSKNENNQVFEGFRAERLPEKSVFILNKETGAPVPISPSLLYNFAKGEKDMDRPFTIYRSPERFKRKLVIGIVHPDFRSNIKIGNMLVGNRGPQICQGVLTGKFDLIDPRKRYESALPSDKLSIKNIPSVLHSMYRFFDYTPDNVEVISLPVKDPRALDPNGSPKGYIEAMEKGMNQRVNCFVVFSPDVPSSYVRDRIYYGTYSFSFQNKIPVIHYRAKTWKAGVELYGLVYSVLAHMVKRFDGTVFKADVGDLWSSIIEGSAAGSFKNPLSVYVDFGPWDGYKVGLITATGSDFTESSCHVTLQAENDEELFGKIDDALKILVKKKQHDFLLTMRDSYFRSVELERMNDVAAELQIPTLPISTVKSGGVAGWKLRNAYRSKGKLRTSPPYGIYMTTPDDSVELFPHDIQLGTDMGIWRSIRLKKEQPYPASVKVGRDWIAKLGMVLASTAEYLPFPSRMKYPKFLRAADKLAEMVNAGVFSTLTTPDDPLSGFYKSFSAGLID